MNPKKARAGFCRRGLKGRRASVSFPGALVLSPTHGRKTGSFFFFWGGGGVGGLRVSGF